MGFKMLIRKEARAIFKTILLYCVISQVYEVSMESDIIIREIFLQKR